MRCHNLPYFDDFLPSLYPKTPSHPSCPSAAVRRHRMHAVPLFRGCNMPPKVRCLASFRIRPNLFPCLGTTCTSVPWLNQSPTILPIVLSELFALLSGPLDSKQLRDTLFRCSESAFDPINKLHFDRRFWILGSLSQISTPVYTPISI